MTTEINDIPITNKKKWEHYKVTFFDKYMFSKSNELFYEFHRSSMHFKRKNGMEGIQIISHL